MQSSAKILVVEDNPELREDLTFELRDAGFNVIEAADGSQALHAFAEQHPDLVVCDIQLPDMDGLSLLESIRSTEDRPQPCPVIVASAFSGLDFRDQAVKLGIEQFLIKPIDYDQIISLIRSSLFRV